MSCELSFFCGLGVEFPIGRGWEEVEEKAMAPDSSTLAWKLPRMEEPGGLQSMGLRRVRHD